MAMNREQRIKRVAKQIGWKPSELVSYGGWFGGHKWNWGKHLRASGRRMPQKLQLRNVRSMNVFLDADFWAQKLNWLKSSSDPCARS
jgi:hypothetical protein